MAINSVLCAQDESGRCYVAQCDRCPRRLQPKGDQDHAQTREAMEAIARRLDWGVRPGVTLCPRCKRTRVR